MKKLLLGILFANLTTTLALAEPETIQRVLKDSTSFVALELNDKSVFCTDLGYGNVQLKVNVPDLDHLAHFDHRVVGEGQPCITAGQCTATTGPGSIIIPGQPLGVAPIRVTLSEEVTMDHEKKTCFSTLYENVRSHIRGHNFTHFRAGETKAVAYDKCLLVRDL